MRHVLHYIKRFLTLIWMGICRFFSFLNRTENKEIKKFKDIHKGERVFIVATGPSLTMTDLELIKDEYSISMNSIISSFNKTSYRPNYYLIQDGNVIDRIADNINASELKDVFVGVGNAHLMKVNVNKKRINKIKKNKIYYKLNSNYHYYDMCYKTEKKHMKFSLDFARQAYDGYTVTYSAIQLAYYMGFKEIYLLGCDCTYGGHFDEKEKVEQVVKPKYFEAYECAKEICEANGVKIYNCTRGGMLEVFERKNLEEVLR